MSFCHHSGHESNSGLGEEVVYARISTRPSDGLLGDMRKKFGDDDIWVARMSVGNAIRSEAIKMVLSIVTNRKQGLEYDNDRSQGTVSLCCNSNQPRTLALSDICHMVIYCNFTFQRRFQVPWHHPPAHDFASVESRPCNCGWSCTMRLPSWHYYHFVPKCLIPF